MTNSMYQKVYTENRISLKLNLKLAMCEKYTNCQMSRPM